MYFEENKFLRLMYYFWMGKCVIHFDVRYQLQSFVDKSDQM